MFVHHVPIDSRYIMAIIESGIDTKQDPQTNANFHESCHDSSTVALCLLCKLHYFFSAGGAAPPVVGSPETQLVWARKQNSVSLLTHKDFEAIVAVAHSQSVSN